MPKVTVLRKGSTRGVKMPARVARKLVSSGGFSYVDEDTTISKPKRAAKADHATRRAKAVEEERKEGQAKGATATGPMTMGKPMKPSELQALTLLDLKALAARRGVNVKPGDTKDDLVGRLYRYLRRDMRAAR